MNFIKHQAIRSVPFMAVAILLLFSCTTVFGQIFSRTSGSWGTGSNWSYDGVNSCACVPGASDDVIIRHEILTGSTARSAKSVTITNSVDGQNAKLSHSHATVSLTIGTGGLTINNTNDFGGDVEFSVTGGSTVTINGDVVINKNSNSNKYAKFRLGGNGTTTATINITGNLTANYLNNSIDEFEAEHEISIGSTSGDSPTLNVLTGTTSLIYNYNNDQSNNLLAFQVGNNSTVNLNTLTMSMINGGTTGGVRFTLTGDAEVNVSGATTLNYTDDDPGTELWLELGTNASPANTANLSLSSLTLSSGRDQEVNNFMRVRGDGTAVISGDLTFSSQASTGSYSLENRIEASNNGVIEIQGDLINVAEGSFQFYDNSVIIFSGAASQTIPTNIVDDDHKPQNYKNIEIDNSSGVTLSGDIAVDGAITLTSGILNSGANLITLTDGGKINGGSTTSYIDGAVRKTCPSGTCGNALSFPVGDDGQWAPIQLDNISGLDASTEITVEYKKSGHPTTTTDGTFDHISGLEYWNIDVDGKVPTIDITFYWKDACFSEIQDLSTGINQDLFVGHFNGVLWEKLIATIGGGSNACGFGDGTGSISVIGVNDFSPFTFISQSNNNTLPIELSGFDLAKENGSVVLMWQTESEQNNDFFVVERTQNPENKWEAITTIKGQGTTTETTNYSALDRQPLAGNTYYRLKQVNTDGTFQYSPVRSIDIKENELQLSVLAYPNPATTSLTIASNRSLADAVVQFVSANGTATTIPLSDSTENQFLDLTSFVDGLYLLRVQSGGTLYEQRIIVQKN